MYLMQAMIPRVVRYPEVNFVIASLFRGVSESYGHYLLEFYKGQVKPNIERRSSIFLWIPRKHLG